MTEVRLARRIAAVAAAFVVLVLPLARTILTAPPAAANPSPITGIGSSFAALEMNQWQADTARRPYNLAVNYSAQGSSVGRGQFASGQVDFGASDIVFPPADGNAGLPTLQSSRCHTIPLQNCFRYVPVSAGGLSFMYNLYDNSGGRVTNLQLTRRQVCQIFTGQITDWGQILPGFSGRPIRVYTRSDGAGESYVLSQFCIAVDPTDWQTFINAVRQNPDAAAPDLLAGQPVSSWPSNVLDLNSAVSGGDGVANAVASGDTGKDSIGYDAAGYAKVRNVPVASVQNAAGFFTQPDETNVTVALAYATPNTDPSQLGTFHLNFNGADPRAYFPSTYSYVLTQTGGWDPNKGSTMAQFLCYAVGQGQVVAPNLRYARLSSQIVAISVAAINQIPTSPAGQCVPTGPPPPAPITVVPGTIGPNGTTTTIGSRGPNSVNSSGQSNVNATVGPANGTAGTTGSAGSANGAAAGNGGPNGNGSSSENGGSAGTNGCAPAMASSTSSSTTSTTTAAAQPTGAPVKATTTSSTAAARPCRITLTTSMTNTTNRRVDNEQVILTLLTGAFVGFVGAALIGGLRRRAS